MHPATTFSPPSGFPTPRPISGLGSGAFQPSWHRRDPASSPAPFPAVLPGGRHHLAALDALGALGAPHSGDAPVASCVGIRYYLDSLSCARTGRAPAVWSAHGVPTTGASGPALPQGAGRQRLLLTRTRPCT
jgi:hypothetical protein